MFFSVKPVNLSINLKPGLTVIAGCETPDIFCDQEGTMTVSGEMQDCDYDGILDPACIRTQTEGEGGTSVAKFFPSSQICLDPSKDPGTFRGVRVLNSCRGTIYHKTSVHL